MSVIKHKVEVQCPHCHASFVPTEVPVYEYKFDVLHALLLLAMGRHVRSRQNAGLPFTAANQVRVPELEVSHAIRCRTTQASKLGLVAKCLNAKKRQVPGVWVVTERGWAALRGEPVPRFVRVRNGEIEERTGEVITLSAAFHVHQEAVEAATARNRLPKSDYRVLFEGYKPEEWYEIAGPVIPRRVPQPASLFS